MKKAGFLFAAFLIGLVIASILPANANAAPQPLSLPADYSVLGAVQADVTGDGYIDAIYLTGHKRQIDSLYTDDLSIAVKNGADQSLTRYPLSKVGGYRMKLFAGDFSGDKVADVYVEVESGGSGGWSYHNIISLNANDPKEIFGAQNNQSQIITGKFIDGLKAELTNTVNGKTIAIDVSERLKDYLRLGIYGEDGIVKKETSMMIAPFSRLEPIDYDRDGIFELKGIQRISGAYRADGIADVETVLKYNGTAWNSQSVKVTVFMDTAGVGTVTPKPASSSGSIITSSKRLLETEYAKIYYPQFTSLDSFITMNIVNAEIEKVVLEYSKREPGAKVELDYKITRQAKGMISVLFTGFQTWEGGKYDLMRAVNIDLTTRQVLNAKNLFKEDESSQKGISALLKTAALDHPAVTHTPNFGTWMGIYFTGENAVFFYMESDFAAEHVQLTVSLNRLKQYMNSPM